MQDILGVFDLTQKNGVEEYLITFAEDFRFCELAGDTSAKRASMSLWVKAGLASARR